MKRRFTTRPILSSETVDKYYLIDGKGNKYSVDRDVIGDYLSYGGEDLLEGQDFVSPEEVAEAGYEYLESWAKESAAEYLGLSVDMPLYIPKEFKDEFYDWAYDMCIESGLWDDDSDFEY